MKHPGSACHRAMNRLVLQYHRAEVIAPDPLEFVLRYRSESDREIVGLLASGLAYGRVAMIHRNVTDALERLGPPDRRLKTCCLSDLEQSFRGFKHRFTSGEEIAHLLWAAGCMRRDHGSLGARFRSLIHPDDTSTWNALARWARELRTSAPGPVTSLLPDPAAGSACKRLHLYLRWMIRHDAVDPGVWKGIAPALLVVPLDTHLHRMARVLGLTRRNAADARTADEITAGFRALCPEDPVRYDFALTRPGILTGATAAELRRILEAA